MAPEQEQQTTEQTAEEKAFQELFDRLEDQLKNGEVEERIAAVEKIIEAHNIEFYPVLRKAVMNDPDQAVRDAVLKATYTMEEEFGEDECLAVQEEKGGSYVEGSKNNEDSAVIGNFLNVSLNAYR